VELSNTRAFRADEALAERIFFISTNFKYPHPIVLDFQATHGFAEVTNALVEHEIGIMVGWAGWC
jgi:hypothetical protein